MSCDPLFGGLWTTLDGITCNETVIQSISFYDESQLQVVQIFTQLSKYWIYPWDIYGVDNHMYCSKRYWTPMTLIVTEKGLQKCNIGYKNVVLMIVRWPTHCGWVI